jgi:ferredoxin
LDRLGLLDETLRTFDSALPRVVTSRCLVTRYRASSCRRCADVCPVGAITLGPLSVNADLCIACGACAAACRTGALDYPQPRALVHEVLSESGGGEVVMACSQATADQAGVVPHVVIACLASLSASDLIAAAAGGRQGLLLVSGDCESCAAKGPAVDFDLRATPTAAWLDAVGVPLALRRETTASTGAPLGPPATAVSRRDLFGLLMGRGRVVAAAALASPSPRIEDLHAVTGPPAVHARLLADLKSLCRGDVTECEPLPRDIPFAVVQISDACDSCSLCTRYCPHGALTSVEGRIDVDANSCTGCGLCAEMCPPAAIALLPAPSLA